MPTPSSIPDHRASQSAATFCIVAGSSILFCSKGVFAKLAYAHGGDALTVLALRMGFSLPFFILIAFAKSRGATPLRSSDWLRLAGLGFVGYYLSSLVNFTGLQYVSVGLERIILYTYPSMILAFSAFVLHKPVSGKMWIACFAAWAGICTAFTGELHSSSSNEKTILGAALIFGSALTYGTFILLSGPTIQRVGAMRFTGFVVGFSCILILLHYALLHPIGALFQQPPVLYGIGLILALFGTVAPALLLSIGLQRAGSQRFAVISSVGPVTTIFLAWAVLGEQPNVFQTLGFLLTLGGGLAISLLKEAKA